MRIKIYFFFLFTLIFFHFNIFSEFGIDGSNHYLTGLGIAASYVGVSSQTAFDRSDQGSLEMWVYPTTLSGGFKTLISKGANTNVTFLWAIGTDGRQFFRINYVDFINFDGVQIPLNTWTHLAVTWSGGPNFNVKFYVNGIKTGSDVINNIIWLTNTDQLRIGSSQAFAANPFLGNLDEIRFWNIALTPDKINANRFIGLGDLSNSNINSALTSSYYYSGLISSWTFNSSNLAYDMINGYNGTYYGSAVSSVNQYCLPVPYNFALKFGGGSNDYFMIPNAPPLMQMNQGTIEFWYKPLSFAAEQVLISKGTSPSNLSLILGVTASTGKLYFGYGTNIAMNSSGLSLNVNQWNHVCVTWSTSGSNVNINFYKNGKPNGSPSVLSAPMISNTLPVWVGNSAVYNLPAKGYFDELRIWPVLRSANDIKNNIFSSVKGMYSLDMLFGFNFDGSLLNFGIYSSINGTFNNTFANKCRFSGYLNDTIPGSAGVNYISHSTSVNRTGSLNTFPSGFNISEPFITIPDNNPIGISDSILINSNITLNSVEALVSVEHPFVGDIIISLIAPNGYSRNLTVNQGGVGDNVLSFFNDNFPLNAATPGFFPPWNFLKPMETFGNFNNSPVSGWWKLKVVDNAGGDVGVLEGWGIRFNNLVNSENNSDKIPLRYYLYQNYPNPFNPVTNIKFELPEAVNVSIKMYDIIGREVNILTEQFLNAGTHIVKFDASAFSSGTYFYKITAGSFTDTKRMILIK